MRDRWTRRSRYAYSFSRHRRGVHDSPRRRAATATLAAALIGSGASALTAYATAAVPATGMVPRPPAKAFGTSPFAGSRAGQFAGSGAASHAGFAPGSSAGSGAALFAGSTASSSAGEEAHAEARSASDSFLQCIALGYPDPYFEAYGPTDVNAQAGNGRLAVGLNKAGTITVYKYPNPSYSNQVKYVATRRDDTGQVENRHPNEGSFAGIRYEIDGEPGFAWLRDWEVSQRYRSPDTPVPVTTYRSPPELGLTVTVTDYATPAPLDAFVRNFSVRRAPGSPVTSARLIYYENFNPVASRIPYLPIQDWCLPRLTDQLATYDRSTHSIVHSWRGIDLATFNPASVAHAFGFDGPDSQHQVGGDEAFLFSFPADGFRQASTPPYNLGGSGLAVWQATGTLAKDLEFDADGRADARLTIASGHNRRQALDALATARTQSFADQMEDIAGDWHRWLRRAKLPASSDPRVVEVAKRSLISIRLAQDTSTGAIVASSDTQGPYGEDWIRDGAFINEVLDLNGYRDRVTAHNLFYARVQTSPRNLSILRPPGNWPMDSYADGVDGGPIPYEIDETGLGAWTLWRHYLFLEPGARRAYLRRVYPAIARAANHMTRCEDHSTGLQCPAHEDDQIFKSQTLHGAGPVYLGLKSALAAARAMGDNRPRVRRWRRRLVRHKRAIEALWDPQFSAYKQAPGDPSADPVSFGDGGWLLWPVRLNPYSNPRMQGEAQAVAEAAAASFTTDRGAYEAKAVLGLAHAWKPPTPAQAHRLKQALRYMASTLTTPTGLFGEAWKRFSGRPLAIEDMPHVWEHSLFYLATIEIYGARPYAFGAGK